MRTIDGSQGEGGGQVLRTSLALSVCLGKPFRIINIRANRKKPGLMRQHRTSVLAAAEIGSAEISGAEMGSQELTFVPHATIPGEYRFDIGSAGSTTLVLQTVLPPLLTAAGPSRLVLCGGTHNPLAPPFDFLEQAFLPLVQQMGPRVTALLERPGFFPAGGGQIEVHIEPAGELKPLSIEKRGDLLGFRAVATVANLPVDIARRELKELKNALSLNPDQLKVQEVSGKKGAANVLSVRVESENITEVFTGFGERGVRAETVARRLAGEVRHYLDAGVAAGTHLADQLLIPMALAGGGSFTTLKPTVHTTTNMEVIAQFTGLRFGCEPVGKDAWRVAVPPAGSAGG